MTTPRSALALMDKALGGAPLLVVALLEQTDAATNRLGDILIQS
jgi:hypothetical protein